jgi:ribosomal protein S24E
MKSKIISQKKNPFLGREEILIEFENNTTPSYEEIKKSLGKNEDLTVIKKVRANFGRYKFVADVVVYEDKDRKDKVEVIPKKIRKKMAEEKKKAEEEARKAAEATKKAEEEAKAQENKTEEVQ